MKLRSAGIDVPLKHHGRQVVLQMAMVRPAAWVVGLDAHMAEAARAHRQGVLLRRVVEVERRKLTVAIVRLHAYVLNMKNGVKL